MSVQQRLNDEVAIDGAGDGLAHARILQERVARIEGEVLKLRAGRIVDDQAGAPGEDRQRVHGKGIDGHVARSLFEFERLGDGVGHYGEAHALKLRARRSN